MKSINKRKAVSEVLQLYSKGCEHAILALIHLDRSECRNGFSLSTLCAKAGLPEPSTRKVFQLLVKNGVLSARRGPGGGYRFIQDPRSVSLLSVVHAIDGKDAFSKCVVQDSPCDTTEHCSLHAMWMKTKDELIKKLQQHSIEEMMAS